MAGLYWWQLGGAAPAALTPLVAFSTDAPDLSWEESWYLLGAVS
jgi:hypothetical protein